MSSPSGNPTSGGAGPSSGDTHIADGDLFRAWFENLYSPSGEFLQELLAHGVDPHNLQRRYSSQQFVDVAKIIRAHAHAREEDDTAYREIGRDLMRAFFATTGGRLLAIVLQLVPTRTFLHRVPSYLRIGRPNVLVEASDQLDGGVRLTAHDPDHCPPQVFAGVIEEACKQSGAVVSALVTRLSADQVAVDIHWT